METNITTEIIKVFSPSQAQQAVLDAMKSFIFDENSDDYFILDGSAGTGKTTLIKSLIDLLEKVKMEFVLLAPTGRAAQVLSGKTAKKARTLHSYLYTIKEYKDNEGHIIRIEFVPKQNLPEHRSIFIIDEASMVSDVPTNNEYFTSKNSVLNDLKEFYINSPGGSKLIFVGDNYQLPPVEDDELSPALSPEYLGKQYGLKGVTHKLTEVFRQQGFSYILQNAEMLKKAMDRGNIYFNNLKYKNLYRIDLAIKHYAKLFDPNNPSKIIFLGWKNRVISKLNHAIRQQVFASPDMPLCPNEQIILNKSFYGSYYLPTGEIGKVIEYYPERTERVADTTFGEAKFQFTMPTGEQVEFTSKFNLDFLLQDDVIDDPEKEKALWADRYRRNKVFRDSENPMDDPYLSALKIRYGYAITTHKAQGGEWDYVILYPEFPFDKNRLRWVYTAVTRGRLEVYSSG